MHPAITQGTEIPRLLKPLLDAPASSAVLCDIDGTLAPIAERADEAIVPQAARTVLSALAKRYSLVACISGRRAAEARSLVGVGSIAYVGNHGLERIMPPYSEPEIHPRLEGHESGAVDLIAGLSMTELRNAQLRVEDKGPIQALHWRGARDEDGARHLAERIASEAAARGLHPHWGRKVLEIRPDVDLDKGTAIADLVSGAGVAHVLFGGDDATDVDGFRRLRELRQGGAIETAVCVGVISAEGPAEIEREADVAVEGTAGFLELLRTLV